MSFVEEWRNWIKSTLDEYFTTYSGFFVYGLFNGGNYFMSYDTDDLGTLFYGHNAFFFNYMGLYGKSLPIFSNDYLRTCEGTTYYIYDRVVPFESDNFYHYVFDNGEQAVFHEPIVINISSQFIDAWNRNRLPSLYIMDYRNIIKANFCFNIGFYRLCIGDSQNQEDYFIFENRGYDYMLETYRLGKHIYQYTFVNGLYISGEYGLDIVDFYPHEKYVYIEEG